MKKSGFFRTFAHDTTNKTAKCGSRKCQKAMNKQPVKPIERYEEVIPSGVRSKDVITGAAIALDHDLTLTQRQTLIPE